MVGWRCGVEGWEDALGGREEGMILHDAKVMMYSETCGAEKRNIGGDND